MITVAFYDTKPYDRIWFDKCSKDMNIKIKYFETTEETISEIKIEMCDNERIKLNFDGEIREFVTVLS